MRESAPRLLQPTKQVELAEKIDESDSDEEEYKEPRMVLPGDESFIDDLDSAF